VSGSEEAAPGTKSQTMPRCSNGSAMPLAPPFWASCDYTIKLPACQTICPKIFQNPEYVLDIIDVLLFKMGVMEQSVNY